MDRRRAREQIRFYFVPARGNIRRGGGGRKKGGTNSTVEKVARFVEGNTSVDSPLLHTHTHARVPLRELDDFTVARHVVVSSSPSNPGFSAFPHPSLVIFLSLHPPPPPPPVTARHCLQAPVCTYVYNNVTHTPRPRLFLLFRVAARGSKAGTARGPAWFRQSGGRARSGR